MKKLLIIAAVCTTLFYSCEDKAIPEKIDSLAGTSWMQHLDYYEHNYWSEYWISFTSTHAILSHYGDSEFARLEFMRRYTYDPPTVTIYVDGGYLAGKIFRGTVENGTLYIDMLETSDILMRYEFKKQ